MALANESTPERILSTALRLFNQFGVDRVPVYKIAAEIGISPGNLTYHFPRKQDIIYQLIDNLEAEASQVLKSKRNPGTVELAEYLIRLFRLMWRHHFFFESLTYLTATDEKISLSHERIRDVAQSGSVQRIQDAMAAGDIPPVEAPTTPKILAENMWAVWVNRLSITRHATESHDAGELVVYDCCVHHLSLIQPYATSRFISKLHGTIKEILRVDDETEGAISPVS